MSKIWFISDEHYDHEKIISYCDRPFNDALIMNSTLLKNFNQKVNNNDIVWHLGDFCLVKTLKEVKETIGKLNGRHSLILGNHDRFKPVQYMDCGFEFVSKYPVIYDGFIILSHQPSFINKGTSPYFNLHGHEHNSTPLYDPNYFRMNISVENTNYSPISLNEIKKIIKNSKYISKLGSDGI